MTQITPTGAMKQQIAGSLSNLAGQAKDAHSQTIVHQHITDAAGQVRRGNLDGAKRHLNAAIHTLTPLQMSRHGVADDASMTAAKQTMQKVHRHVLKIQDVQDTAAANEQKLQAAREKAQADRQQKLDDKQARLDDASRNAFTDARAARQAQAQKDLGGKRPEITSLSSQLDFAYNPAEPRGAHGEWIKGLGEIGKLEYKGGPGSFAHARAIRDLGNTYAPSGELAVPALSPYNSEMRTALYNVARSVVQRNMKAANAHIASAMAAARKIGPGAQADVEKVRRSLADVPAGAPSGRNEPRNLPRGVIYDTGPDPTYKGAGFRTGSLGMQFSAQTAALEATPAPIGKPGGPGLYNVRGAKHSNYFEQVRNALMTRRGVSEGTAHAMTWGILRRWARGGGHVHPEVQAAAVKALAEEAATAASAKAQHHANPMMLCCAIELAGQAQGQNKGWNEAAHPRVPKGQPGGGQFGSASKSAQGSKNRAVSRMSDHQKAQLRKQLTDQLHQLHARIAMVRSALRTLEQQAHHASAQSKAQQRKGPSKQQQAAKSGTAAQKAAAGGKTPAARAGSKPSAGGIHGKITALRAQLAHMVSQAQQLSAQIARL